MGDEAAGHWGCGGMDARERVRRLVARRRSQGCPHGRPPSTSGIVRLKELVASGGSRMELWTNQGALRVSHHGAVLVSTGIPWPRAGIPEWDTRTPLLLAAS